MVYNLVDWGMGENDTSNQNYTKPISPAFRCSDKQFDNDEVDLLPLTNQVGLF